MRQKMPHYFIRWFTSSQTCILVFTPQQVEHVRRHSKPQAEANSGKGRPPLMLNSMDSMKNHQFHFRSIQGASNQREPSPLPAEQHIQVETRKGVGASPESPTKRLFRSYPLLDVDHLYKILTTKKSLLLANPQLGGGTGQLDHHMVGGHTVGSNDDCSNCKIIS